MSKESMILIIIIILILVTGVLVLGRDVHKLKASIETTKDGNASTELQDRIKQLELLQSKMEDKILNLERNLSEFDVITHANLERIDNLLNRTEGIKTIRGIITNINEGEKTYLSIRRIELDDQGGYITSEKTEELECANDFTPYVASQFATASRTRELFLSNLEKNIKNGVGGFESPYTFKIIKGKVVQVIEGYGYLSSYGIDY